MRDIKNRKRWFTGGLLVLVVALIGALVLTACAGGGGNGGNGYEPPPRPWVVRYGFGGGGMSGYLGVDPMSGASVLRSPLAGDILGGFDLETAEPMGFLETRSEWNFEGKYTDHWIREGIPFHNGNIMTAEDVAFSYNRMKDEDIVGAAESTAWKVYVKYAEAIDDYQVRIHWYDMGSPARTVNPFQPIIVPKNYIEEVGWEEWANEPVLSGPMKVVDWERDVYIHLEKAFPEEGHWRWGNVPNYDELIITAVPELATRLAMLKTGELDMAALDPAVIPDVIADPNLTLVTQQYRYPWCILFFDYDDADTPLSDPLVRKAVSLAIDREGIAENVLHGAAEPWGSLFASWMLGYEHREPDPYDPDEARRLLAEAGYPEGFKTNFHYPNTGELTAQAVIASLAEVGIEAQSKPYEVMTWFDKYSNDQLDGMSYSPMPNWHWDPGPVYYPDEVIQKEVMGYGGPVARDIPEVWDALDQILAAETEEEMAAAGRAAEELILDELGYKIVVWAMSSVYAYGPTIEDWDPTFPFFTATYKG